MTSTAFSSLKDHRRKSRKARRKIDDRDARMQDCEAKLHHEALKLQKDSNFPDWLSKLASLPTLFYGEAFIVFQNFQTRMVLVSLPKEHEQVGNQVQKSVHNSLQASTPYGNVVRPCGEESAQEHQRATDLTKLCQRLLRCPCFKSQEANLITTSLSTNKCLVPGVMPMSKERFWSSTVFYND